MMNTSEYGLCTIAMDLNGTLRGRRQRWRDVVKSVSRHSRFRHMDIKIQSIGELNNTLMNI